MNTNVNTNMTPLTQNVSGMVGITECDIPLQCPSFNILTEYLTIKKIILNNVKQLKIANTLKTDP